MHTRRYPIYAAEAHPAYTHWFLNWLLKVVNLPSPSDPLKLAQLAESKRAGGQQTGGIQPANPFRKGARTLMQPTDKYQ